LVKIMSTPVKQVLSTRLGQWQWARAFRSRSRRLPGMSILSSLLQLGDAFTREESWAYVAIILTRVISASRPRQRQQTGHPFGEENLYLFANAAMRPKRRQPNMPITVFHCHVWMCRPGLLQIDGRFTPLMASLGTSLFELTSTLGHTADTMDVDARVCEVTRRRTRSPRDLSQD
jgi:hypothetical protein